MKFVILFFTLFISPTFWLVTNTPQSIPFSQDWSDTSMITANDNWSGVPGIVGYRGDGLTSSTNTDPQTILADGTGVVDVLRNKTDPETTNTGGVAEFEITDPTIALQGSGTADAPFILIHLSTTGFQNINVSYNVRDLEVDDDVTQQVALHYRIGNTGDFTNLPAGYIADATDSGTATKVTPISVTLPAAANDQAEVQVRVMTSNASGADEWVGIDDILITGDVVSGGSCSISNISTSNISVCDDKGTSDPSDDTFTADVTVMFSNAPATGTLDLTGDGTASVSVSGLSSPHTFTGVEMSADGTAISMTAAFSDAAACTLTDNTGTAPAFCSAACHLVINEVDYDQPGSSDIAEFIELYNPCSVTINLDNYRVRLFNGNNGGNYKNINLSNVDLAAGGYYVICLDANTTPNCDMDAGFSSIQNGAPDAISLELNMVQVDGLSYEGDNANTAPYVEGTGTVDADSNTEEAVGLSRFPDGNDTDDNDTDFKLRCITPGTANVSSAAACLPCVISDISVANVSACDDKGTPDPSDDTFTADVTVTFADRPNTGLLNLSGDGTASVSAIGLASPHTFTGVEMSADGTAISLTATFSNLQTCTLTNSNAGTAPSDCSAVLACDISDISVANISACNGQGTGLETDDTFTVDVTVTFANPPATGTLDLSGDGTASVSVAGLTSPHTFTGVTMSADGTAISLVAAFSADGACTLANSNAGTAPNACSACNISSISLSDISACNDNGTVDPSDDTFTANVTVNYINPPSPGTIVLSGDAMSSVSVGSGSSSHMFGNAVFSADGGTISLTANFQEEPACSFTDNGLGTAPASCSPCDISNISVGNISACNDNGTPLPGDDTFTADITVAFANLPATGTLDLSGDGTASVSVAGLSSPHTFTGVSMSADGTAISLTAAFSADAVCALTNNNAGTAPAACSCGPVINEVDYSQPGNDNAEFVELYNSCTSTVNLDFYTLELVNGLNGNIYETIDLPNVDLAPGAYYVICSTDNPAAYCDLSAINSLQNGAPDAVSLKFNGTQVDGLSYEGDTAGVTEGSGTGLEDPDNVEAVGLSRFPNGVDTEVNNADFSLRCITPGAANDNASSSGCLNCGITSITVSNVSACEGFGTGDPSDDVFTADVTVEFADRPNNGALNLTGDGTASVNANGLISPHTFTGVSMVADGSDISLTAKFGTLPTCTLTNSNAGTAPASCSDCNISSISLSNVSVCDNKGTIDPTDDTFTADVTVDYVNPPFPGTIVLSGDATANTAVGEASTTQTLTGVVFSADGGTISLTAAFQEETACSFTDSDLGTAPASCSPCDISGISLSSVTSCNDNGTANPADDFFTADVTVDFLNPPSAGVLSLSGSGTGVVAATGLGTSHTFQDVLMGADGSVIGLTAAFSDNPACSFTNANAGMAPSACSPCGIESISLSNMSSCNNNLTGDPNDDFFTADVTVTYFQAPATGTLDISGSAVASIGSFGANSHIFTGITFSADGNAIDLTASFSDLPACSLTEEVGTAPFNCSGACFVSITSITVQNETCPGYADGSISIEAVASSAQVGYSIDGGVNFIFTNTFNNLPAGAYPIVVKVFGANGCSDTGMATILPAPQSALKTWYKDLDNDFYSDGLTIMDCNQPAGYKLAAALLALSGDCNDNDPLQFPGQTWYKDSDGDGYSDGTMLVQCGKPAGHEAAQNLTAPSGDCNDGDVAVNPGATEICDGIDNNCNGSIDENLSGQTFNGSVVFYSQAQLNAWLACYSIINGSVTISGFDINDLGSLSGITQITGSLTIYFNSNLVSLNGLDNLNSVGGSLLMYYNFQLSNCCAIDGLLANNGVGGIVFIFFNASGCNSEAEIGIACTPPSTLLSNPNAGSTAYTASVSAGAEKRLSLYPNPASNEVNILLGNIGTSATLRVMDMLGRVVFEKQLEEGTDRVSIGFENGRFQNGIYLVSLSEGGEMISKQLVVQQQ